MLNLGKAVWCCSEDMAVQETTLSYATAMPGNALCLQHLGCTSFCKPWLEASLCQEAT